MRPTKYHKWFRELGYSMLDILQYNNGEWEIIQYLNSPIIPSLTRYQTVLGVMRNVEINRGFVEKYVKKLDINRREFWAREEKKTREVEEEHEKTDLHSADLVDRAHKAITKNPAMMERIAQNGTQEMDLDKLARHVPRSEVYKPRHKGERIATIPPTKEGASNVLCDPSQSAEQVIHAPVST